MGLREVGPSIQEEARLLLILALSYSYSVKRILVLRYTSSVSSGSPPDSIKRLNTNLGAFFPIILICRQVWISFTRNPSCALCGQLSATYYNIRRIGSISSIPNHGRIFLSQCILGRSSFLHLEYYLEGLRASGINIATKETPTERLITTLIDSESLLIGRFSFR